MPSLRKHSTEDLWTILLAVRRRHEEAKGGILAVLADLMLGQQVMIGLMLRDKRDKDKHNAKATTARYSHSFKRHYQPEGPAGIEEAIDVVDSTVSPDPNGQGHGTRGEEVWSV